LRFRCLLPNTRSLGLVLTFMALSAAAPASAAPAFAFLAGTLIRHRFGAIRTMASALGFRTLLCRPRIRARVILMP
jgi:hypothetical protein